MPRVYMAPALAVLAGLIQYASAQTQTSSTPAHRDAAALTAVQSAIAALGGQANLSTIQDATVDGSCTSADSGSNPQETATQTVATPQTVTWTVAGSQFRYETMVAGQQHLLVSGQGQPQVNESGTIQQLSPLLAAVLQPYHIPGLVLAHDFEDPSWTFKYLGEQTVAGAKTTHVKIFKTIGGWPVDALNQDWYFNPATNLPVQVKYRIPTDPPSAIYVTSTVVFSSFAGQQTPFAEQIVMETNGSNTSTCTLGAPAFNTHPQQSEFAVSN